MEFKWNPYPETKPEKEGRYLITYEDEGEKSITVDEFDNTTNNEWWDTEKFFVTAWAKLPEPYEKPIRLKAYSFKKSEIPSDRRVILINNETGGWSETHLKSSSFTLKGYTHWAEMPEFDFVEEE